MGQGEAEDEVFVRLVNLLLGLPLHGATLFTPCGLTTSLTAETGTVLGDGVGGGERGAVTGGVTVESEEDGNVERTGELGIAGSLLLVLLEGKLGPLSVELSAARMCASS